MHGASRYARLAQLASDADLRYERRSYEPDANYEGSLQKVKITMVLEGEYRNMRRFIHDLETAPEFVVIEDVALAEGADSDAPLTLTLQLATFFRRRDMEAKTRSQGLLLAGLLAVLALALWWNFGGVADEHATAAGSDRVRPPHRRPVAARRPRMASSSRSHSTG